MADPNIVNPYERIWKTRDLRALEAPIELENNTSQFGRGLNAFGKEMQATGYGLAALGAQGLENVIGENAVTSGITNWGVEGYKKAINESQSGYNAPNVADIEDIKGVNDFTDWTSYQLGKGLPMLGSLALSGGVGGAIGRLTAQEGVKQIAKGAVGSAVKKGIETKASQAAEGQIITKAMQETAAKALRDRTVAGAMTGGFAGSFGLEGGLAFGEQVDAGVKPEDAVKSAIAVGGINGALEFLPFYKVAKDIGMGQYAKKSIAEIIKNDAGLSKKAVALATAKELGGRAAKGGLEGAAAEGITEGLQELTSIAGLRWAKQDPLFADLTDDDWNRIGNAAAAGALVGGVAAGTGATLKGPEITDSATTDTNAPPAGTIAPAVKTREQELEATLAELTANLEAAKAAGDTKTIQELQQLKESFDAALGKQKPAIEPVVETPPNEQITQEQPIPGATETQVQSPMEVPAGPEGTSGVREEGTGAETREATGEVVQPRPGESIQLKRGEEIVLTPDGTPARTTPTQEEVEALRQRMGPRPEKQTTQPIEEMANGQEVQAQTEAEVKPLLDNSLTDAFKENDVGKIITFTPSNEQSSVGYADTGKPYKILSVGKNGKNIQVEDQNGSRTIVNLSEVRRHAQSTNGVPFTIVNSKNVDSETQVKSTSPLYSKPIGEIKFPNEGAATEATMEEFEAVRRQFQERQSQTPFKKWFGTGTPNITATKEGEPITLYHGTNNPAFYEWDSTKAGEASGHPTSGLGFFMTADQGAAARYGDNLLALHAKINNPYTLTDADLTRIETSQDAAQLRKRLMAKGYDGAIVTAPGASPYVIAFQANQIKLKSNTTPTDSSDMRYSRPLEAKKDSQQPSTTSISLQDLQSNIDFVMGQGWLQRAQELGLVEVIEGAGPSGEAGSWAGDRIRLYTNTMPKNGSPAGVLLHEGKHVTFENVLGNSLPEYVKDLHALADNGNKIAQDAITHAAIAVADVLGIKHNLLEGGTKADLKNLRALIEQERPGLLAEEELAYFVQYGADAQTGTGFWKRLVNQIKAWFAQTRLGQRMKELGIGFELTDAMAVEWAKIGLNRSLENLQQAEKARAQAEKQATTMPASARLGKALGMLEEVDPLYAMTIAENKQVDKEIEAVKKKYANTPQWMKAPNGKPTKLNERQWLQVRTPAFKNWFGDWENDSMAASQVVDANGEPLVVYHGTNKTDNFTEFNIRSNGTAYFTTKKEYANDMSKRKMVIDPITANDYVGQVIPVYLKLNNPAKLKASILEDLGYSSATIEKLKTLGHDGATSKDGQIAVFSPTQIKSTIGNVGTFSLTDSNILYSMGIREIREGLWNDPTDIRPEIVNKPGLLQKWRADFIDFFAEMEKKSKGIYDTYSLLRSKKAARIEQARQEYFLPLRKLIAESPWTAQEVGDMAAARHIKVDNVNTRLAQRASYGYTKELLKALSTAKRKELMQARINVKAGKMPDGSVYLDANGNPAQMSARTKQQLMFDLMNQYSQYEIANANGIQVLREEWELFKDAAAGFSDGGIGNTKVRTVDDVLKAADKDRAKFDQIMTLFDAANRHTLEILEDGGLITAAEHARLLLDKSAYAPLRRESYKVDEEIARLFQRAGQGGSKQIATRSGTENLSEPTLVLQNALAAVEAAAAAAERNLANKELYKVVVKDREGWKPWFTIVEKEKYVTHDEDGFLQEKNATASNRADITLINDGKKLVIRPNMHNERAMGFVRAVNNLDAQVVNGPMKVLGWLNQIVRWVNVSASPIFLMTNAFKDPFTALYNIQATEAEKYTKEIFNPKTYKDSFRALKKVFMDGNRDPTNPDVQWVEKWELAGGRTSFIETLRDMDETWKSFDAQVSRRKGTVFGINAPGFKNLMQAKDKWIDGIENFNILFENVMRFSTFKVLMEKGAVSEAQAARISQDLTTNFTRRGYKTQALGTWWLFFNASVQGNYQVLRNLMSSRKVQVAVGGTVVMALLLDLFGRAVDDDWDKIPEWDKERFIILPVKVAGDFVRIPAPWVYNVVWRTGGLLGEMLSGIKKPQDGLLDIAAMITTTFNPLGKPGSLAQAISPTGFDPFMQIIENKNFAGNPIGPEGFPGASKKANSELMWSSTPQGYQSFARFINEATGGSAVESGAIDLKPGDYQILVNFLTGSLGRFMADTTFGVKEALDKDFEGMRDIPVAKEFFSDPYDPLKSQKYHTNIAGIYGAHKLEQMYIKGPDRDLIKLQEVRESRGKELRMYSQAQDVERQLKSLRVRLRTAQNRGDTVREKELRDKIGKIQERFNNVYQQKMG